MQKFILIRGHQGSGKSTFAQQKKEEFLTYYPNATIIHLENDLLLTDENGQYHWSAEAVQKAQQQNMNTFKQQLKYGQQHPNQHILIINSNTNQKATSCKQLIQIAQKYGFDTEVYRLHNFFETIHRVKKETILDVYIRLNQNPVADEIHVPAVCPMDQETVHWIEQINHFTQQPLAFDETQHTYVTPNYLTLAKQNFTRKQSKIYPELSVLKYKNKIFYDNKFDEALLEMRGLIIDQYDKIIVRPFKKVFNYSERIAANSLYPIQISDDQLVDAVVKINGFLGVCTYIKLNEQHPSYHASFNHHVIYSTTGSLDSPFAQMTKEHCSKYEHLFKSFANHTFLFEITDPNDLHIIQEDFGETLIGIVEVETGKMFTESALDDIAQQFNLRRPQTIRQISFGHLKNLLKTVKHEGFMVFDSQSQELLFKLKSPFYLISKFLGRGQIQHLNRKLNKQNFDEEYYPLIDHIHQHQEQFTQLSEHDKIAWIKNFLEQL